MSLKLIIHSRYYQVWKRKEAHGEKIQDRRYSLLLPSPLIMVPGSGKKGSPFPVLGSEVMIASNRIFQPGTLNHA
jgi:hypothetical protein